VEIMFIVSRTPLRLTLGGGGTDLPSYYLRFGGFVVTSSLDKYVYVIVKRRFEEDVRVSYSITEIVSDVNDIKHPLVREALKLLGISKHLEIVSIADVPSRAGLGSSGSFTVGLLHALHAFKGENPSKRELAEEACYIEMDVLKEPCGKQDQYIAAFGGFKCLHIDRSGKVEVEDLKISDESVRELENNLLFFYTGIVRDSFDVLHNQQKRMQTDGETLEAMHKIKEIGFKAKKALETGDLAEWARLQHEHWMAKRRTAESMTTSLIDRWYKLGIENGAIGGKLMGAGGGGFLMFYAENNKNRIRKVMAEQGLREVRFGFSREGSKIVINM
jgi:D-glycero-alpha-D-manno-heptose-7-phosphate kinase